MVCNCDLVRFRICTVFGNEVKSVEDSDDVIAVRIRYFGRLACRGYRHRRR